MAESSIPDAPARERAMNPQRSFIVQAPAGSGKTELLIQRFLLLLARVSRPEEIVSVTFTKKAAAEMRARIYQALRSARETARPQALHKAKTWDLAQAALERNEALGWKLEESPARLRIQTIDALCVSLTRQMPVLARFGGQPQSIEDASELYAQAARNTVAVVDSDEDALAADMARLLLHLDNNALRAEDLFVRMLAHRDHWLRYVHEADNRAALERALARVRVETVRRARALLPPSLLAPASDDEVDAWIAFAKELLTKEGVWRKKHPLYDELCEMDALCAALKTVQTLPPAHYSDEQWEALGAITRLLPRAVAELRVVFATHGQADFIEIAQGALRALEGEDGPTDLLLSLDYRLRHILVDEFQDTSYSQFDLLEKLTAGWQADDGRTLFVVGDPMQSIYRFREAQVGLFLRAQRTGIGGVQLEPLMLTANFRSQAAIVSWVNSAFAQVMPAVEDIAAGAVTCALSHAVHPPLPEAVTVHPFFNGDAAGEAAAVVELARAALEAPGLDPQQPSTTAILVRNRSHLLQIIPSLKEAGLAFRAIDIEPLQHRPVIRDLLALTRAIAHLADRTAWLAILRAPWCGLTLHDLDVLFGGSDASQTAWELLNEPSRVSAMSLDGQRRLGRAREVLDGTLSQRLRGTIRGRVQGAWLALGGPACVQDPTDLEDAELFFDRLEAMEEAGAVADIALFEQSIAKLFALPDMLASERLQIMTIHRAKGLEFDTVILAGLGAGTNSDERPLFLWLERTSDLLLAPINPTGSNKDPLYEFIRALDRDKAEYENGRLLYVAATRAKKTLHLLGDTKRGDDGEPKTPPRSTLLAKLWPVVCPQFAGRRLPSDPLSALVSDELTTTELRRLPGSWVLPPAPAETRWQHLQQLSRTTEQIEFSWAGEIARHVGTLVHRWLEQIAREGPEQWNSERVRGLRRRLQTQLSARGVAEAEVAAAAQRVSEALIATMTSVRGRWILAAHSRSSSELRMTTIVDGQARALAIDRTFVDANGVRWIVDFKTSTHQGTDIEAFLDREALRYRGQMELYARSLAPLAEGPTMLGLYFPLLGGWREWEAAASQQPVLQ